MNEILHNPALQKLEGTWRGLHYLVKQTNTGDHLQIRVLNVTKDEIRNDLEKAVEFDMSETFKKVYEEEYGTLGGNPFGMLVGDYDYDVRRSADVKVLQGLSGVAAAAHAPLVACGQPEVVQHGPVLGAGRIRATSPRSSPVPITPPGSRSANRTTRATSH